MDDESSGPGEVSPLDVAARAVGDRWSLLIVDALLTGPGRFADLERQVDGVSPNVLSRRLKDLESAGIIEGRPYSTRPPRHDYRLTARGRDLAPVISALSRWGEHLAGVDDPADVDPPADHDEDQVHYA